jgi:hypothetical protein
MRKHSMAGYVMVVLIWTTLGIPCVKAQKPREYSFALEEARKKGTLITKLTMTPSSITWRQWEITVDEAWLEKSKEGGCYLCFRIDKGKEAFLPSNNCSFVLGDSRADVPMHLGIGLTWIQAVQYLDSPDLSKARFSVVGGLKEKRMKNIQFIPTK